MNAILRQAATIGAFVLSAVTAGAAQGPPMAPCTDQTLPIIQEILATQQFQARVAEYVTLHRLLEGPLPPLRPTADMREIRMTMRALAARIQVARQDARQGDIITPDVARLFKRRIATCLPPEEWAALLAEMDVDEDGVPVPRPMLRVNMEWPVGIAFDSVPPSLLLALPALPPELQYRIIGRSLVLWDHHADLIVDFLPGAFTT